MRTEREFVAADPKMGFTVGELLALARALQDEPYETKIVATVGWRSQLQKVRVKND